MTLQVGLPAGQLVSAPTLSQTSEMDSMFSGLGLGSYLSKVTPGVNIFKNTNVFLFLGGGAKFPLILILISQKLKFKDAYGPGGLELFRRWVRIVFIYSLLLLLREYI